MIPISRNKEPQTFKPSPSPKTATLNSKPDRTYGTEDPVFCTKSSRSPLSQTQS